VANGEAIEGMPINQLRRDPITGGWSIILQQQVDLSVLIAGRKARESDRPENHTACEYCSGHEAETSPEIYAIRRDGTSANSPGWEVRVLPYRSPVLQIYGDLNNRGMGMYDVLDGIGAHEVVVETPDHGVALPDLSLDRVADILFVYRERLLDLKGDARFRYIMVHKSYGEDSGPTALHAYGHIVATPITPLRVKEELINAKDYYQYKERCVFCDVVRQELGDQERVVLENEHFVAIAPFASRGPFETWILPKNHETFFEANTELKPLAEILREVLTRIRNVLNDPHYVLVVHSGPNLRAGQLRGYWKTLERDYHWHIEITPRLRGYTSFEVGSGFRINMVPPEQASRILRRNRPLLEA
jgi:UDPglucose--hexose-1-phosphate uridylyltransferase